MPKKNCPSCKKDFYPYLGRKVYCSEECYLEQKHQDNITNWKNKREKRIDNGKPCRRCKERFKPGFSNSQYCCKCRDILSDKPKKSKKVKVMIIKEGKKCIDCSMPIVNANHNKLYCNVCKEKRRVENGKRSTEKASQIAKKIKANNVERGANKKIDSKWLKRGIE